MTATVTILDPETAPDGVLGAFNPAELDASANSRADAEKTVTAADVTSAKAMANAHEYGCGNGVPAELRRRPDGTLRIRTGHRRAVMCQRAGVPLFAFVAGAEEDVQADLRARLLTQWFENHHRENPKRSDDARTLLTLFDEGGLTEAGIAKALGIKKPEVKTGLAVARSAVASAAVDTWPDLDMEQGAALDEFEGDQQAIGELVAAARSGMFEHTVARLRSTREERAERQAFIDQITEAGYLIYGEDGRGVPWTMNLANLTGPDGEPLDPYEHAACDGAAVTIGYDWAWGEGQEQAYRDAHDLDPDDEIDFDDDEAAAVEAGWAPRWGVVRYLCNDPDAHGHKNRLAAPAGEPATTGQRDAQAEADAAEAKRAKDSAERKRVIARNKEWRAATVTRRAHLKKWLAAPKLPAKLDAPATVLRAVAIARNETQPEMGSFGHRVAATLLGLTDKFGSDSDMLVAAITAATPARAKVIELAMVLGAAEHGCSGHDGQAAETWREAESGYWSRGRTPDRRVRYLKWVVEHAGYTLSGIEQEVIDAATPKPKEPAGPPADVAPPLGQVDVGGGIPDAATHSFPGDDSHVVTDVAPGELAGVLLSESAGGAEEPEPVTWDELDAADQTLIRSGCVGPPEKLPSGRRISIADWTGFGGTVRDEEEVPWAAADADLDAAHEQWSEGDPGVNEAEIDAAFDTEDDADAAALDAELRDAIDRD
jgi:ParB family transcriptional regulator, chromosome partitioning protein